MKKEMITLLGLGDILVDREKPETIFQHVAKVTRSGDITFANCEQNYSDKGYPIDRGHSTNSDPGNIAALLYAGINVVSMANNHMLDWDDEALLDTLARLKEAGIAPVGAGRNLAEARQPVILERKGTKVGFLAYCCIGPEGYEAGENQTGHAPVRVWTIYEKVDPQPATPPRIVSFAYKDELAAMEEDIKKLKPLVDVVVVSFHWGQHFLPRIIPMYCFEVGHAAIDAGADLILGGHAHILKGIEVYKGKVIFYALNNFAAEIGPGCIRGKPIEATAAGKFQKHYRNFSLPAPGSGENKNTIIAKAIIEDGKIQKVSYIPCYINKQSEPEIVARSEVRSRQVYGYIEDISRSEGLKVHFSWDGDEVIIGP
jgi:poly-gamma-glutamate capsule biosynthesis protein CapA/YwtB (metallophosphatase superfamily)